MGGVTPEGLWQSSSCVAVQSQREEEEGEGGRWPGSECSDK